ncbi:ABC-type Mn2+/Zn2+ transport systems permease component [Streptococcus pneumoniae]|nr:ABC-type Mn2+/Zn2+ transport systems permease component [Streptococcus pneumoniae]
MIAEFIDGLQKFHFLQNALITAIVVGIVALSEPLSLDC